MWSSGLDTSQAVVQNDKQINYFTQDTMALVQSHYFIRMSPIHSGVDMFPVAS